MRRDTTNVVAHLTMSALREAHVPPLPAYERALSRACAHVEPFFGRAAYGDLFRSLAIQPEWLIASLVANAQAEGDGARRLLRLARAADETLASKLQQHADDESRHAEWYIAIIDLVFPGTIDDASRPAFKTLSPKHDATTEENSHDADDNQSIAAVTLDSFVQMNIAEIRTRIHHLLQREVLLAFCPAANRERLLLLLDRLLADETQHVAYTAVIIEDYAQNVGRSHVEALFRQRLCDFHAITLAEVDQAASGVAFLSA